MIVRLLNPNMGKGFYSMEFCMTYNNEIVQHKQLNLLIMQLLSSQTFYLLNRPFNQLPNIKGAQCYLEL